MRFNINPKTRAIDNNYSKLGVQGENKIEVVEFVAPKIVGQADLSGVDVKCLLNATTASGGNILKVLPIAIDGENIVVTWEVGLEETSEVGFLKLALHFSTAFNNVFKTLPTTFEIMATINVESEQPVLFSPRQKRSMPMLFSVSPEVDEINVIDNKLIIPAKLQNIAVQNDNESKKVNIIMPRYYQTEDLSKYAIKLHLQVADGSSEWVPFMPVVVGNDLKLEWTVQRPHTSYAGKLRMQIEVGDIATDTFFKQTEIAEVNILNSLDGDTPIVPVSPPEFALYLSQIEAVKQQAVEAKEESVSAKDISAKKAQEALASAKDSQNAKTAAEAAASNAKNSETAAAISASEALSSKNSAKTSETNSFNHAKSALSSKTESAASAAQASTSAEAAQSNRTAAELASASALASSKAAKSSEQLSLTNATNASNSAKSASTSAANAKTSEENAKKSETGAEGALADINTGLVSRLPIAEANQLFKSVAIDGKTGVFTFTRYDGTKVIVDTGLEKVVLDMRIDPDTLELVLKLADGTEQRVSLVPFLNLYTGGSSTTIDVQVNGTIITAAVKGNSIGLNLLTPSLQNLINSKVTANQTGNAAQVKFSDGKNMQEKLDAGDLNGKDGIAIVQNGLFYMRVDEFGHLKVGVPDGVAQPPLSVREGRLIYTI